MGQQPIQRVAIVGTGVIGASWAAEYLARGSTWSPTIPPQMRKSAYASMSTMRGATQAIGLSQVQAVTA